MEEKVSGGNRQLTGISFNWLFLNTKMQGLLPSCAKSDSQGHTTEVKNSECSILVSSFAEKSAPVASRKKTYPGSGEIMQWGKDRSSQHSFYSLFSSVIEQSETMMGTKDMPAKAWREPSSLYHHRNMIPIVKPARTTLSENRSFSGALELVRTSLSPHPHIWASTIMKGRFQYLVSYISHLCQKLALHPYVLAFYGLSEANPLLFGLAFEKWLDVIMYQGFIIQLSPRVYLERLIWAWASQQMFKMSKS